MATAAAPEAAGATTAGRRPPAGGCWSAVDAVRSAAQRCSRDAEDRWLLSLVWRRAAIPDPLPHQALLHVRSLRRPTLACAVSLLIAVGAQHWVISESLLLLDQGAPNACEGMQDWLLALDPKACEGLQYWILAYYAALLYFPFLFLVAAPMLLWWCVTGLRTKSLLSGPCRQDNPALWGFVTRAVLCAVVTFIFLVVFLLLLLSVRRRVNEIQRLWSGGGPTVDAVRRRIMDGPAEDVPCETECTICLETRANTDEGWRTLPCGHHFHRPCLLEWLSRSHCCPLCRCDLHAAHPSTSRSLVAAAEQ